MKYYSIDKNMLDYILECLMRYDTQLIVNKVNDNRLEVIIHYLYNLLADKNITDDGENYR